ncbi:MAG TPA: acylphosphatase [Desulfobulbaceae bacterium]|nr:acylphosphatase [Desulfobulbaceae bacterium]
MNLRRVHVIVRGRVQGVYFREYTRRQAQTLGISGWVRNLPDRSVEVEIEGDSAGVEAMLAWLHRGSPMSAVNAVETVEEEVRGEQGFVVRH